MSSGSLKNQNLFLVMNLFSYLIILSLIPADFAFAPSPRPCCIAPNSQESVSFVSAIFVDARRNRDISDVDDCVGEQQSSIVHIDNRDLFKLISLTIITSTLSIIVWSSSAIETYAASSDLFAPNPLTNPVLEKLRIWNQDEADNIQYNGELSSGSTGPAGFDQYVQLLQPILAVEREISSIDQLLQTIKSTENGDYISRLRKANEILSKPVFDKISFKKAFNAFADNIYYSDPDRANLYLGGGAIPKSTQSLAYLLRNDILTSLEDLRAEVQYLLKEFDQGGTVGEEGLNFDDLIELVRIAKQGMTKYVDLVPPEEVKAARLKFDSI